jgi:hypothetical protein
VAGTGPGANDGAVRTGLSILVDLTFVAAYPWRALTLVALDLVNLYAVKVHAARRAVLTGPSRASATGISAG